MKTSLRDLCLIAAAAFSLLSCVREPPKREQLESRSWCSHGAADAKPSEGSAGLYWDFQRDGTFDDRAALAVKPARTWALEGDKLRIAGIGEYTVEKLTVEELLLSGANGELSFDRNCKDAEGAVKRQSALLECARLGYLDCLKDRLREGGVNINGPSLWRSKSVGAEHTPLTGATAGNHPEAVQLLLASGARPEVKNLANETALQIAERLWERNADRNMNSPGLRALQDKRTKILELLSAAESGQDSKVASAAEPALVAAAVAAPPAEVAAAPAAAGGPTMMKAYGPDCPSPFALRDGVCVHLRLLANMSAVELANAVSGFKGGALPPALPAAIAVAARTSDEPGSAVGDAPQPVAPPASAEPLPAEPMAELSTKPQCQALSKNAETWRDHDFYGNGGLTTVIGVVAEEPHRDEEWNLWIVKIHPVLDGEPAKDCPLLLTLCMNEDLSESDCKAYGPRLRPASRLKVSGVPGPYIHWPVGVGDAVARERLPHLLIHKHR